MYRVAPPMQASLPVRTPGGSPDGKLSLLAASWNSARQRSNAAPPYSRSWLLLGSTGIVKPGHWH